MNWKKVQLKYVTRFAYGDALPRTEDEREGPVKVFGSNGPFATSPYANTKSPAIIIGRKGSYGKINWSNDPCFASDTTFFIDATTTTHDLRWLFYVLQTLDLDKGTDEAAVPGLSRDNAYEKVILVPPLNDQRVIAAYLDRETAKIDALVAAKERLLTLLAEKRRALITHSVIRGLDTKVSMKESGVEWLGAIPAHWKVARLRQVGQVRTGVAKGRNLGGRETILVPYLRVANVQDGYLDLSNVSEIEVLPTEIPTFSLKKGDVLMNEGGDADKLGRGTIWDGSIDPCLHQNHVFAVRCFDVNPIWLATVTATDYAKAYFESRSKQSTNLASISATNLQELPIVIPPITEQHAIIEHIEQAITKLDKMRQIATKTIKLLRERRSALIATAVTGQIDISVDLCNSID